MEKLHVCVDVLRTLANAVGLVLEAVRELLGKESRTSNHGPNQSSTPTDEPLLKQSTQMLHSYSDPSSLQVPSAFTDM